MSYSEDNPGAGRLQGAASPTASSVERGPEAADRGGDLDPRLVIVVVPNLRERITISFLSAAAFSTTVLRRPTRRVGALQPEIHWLQPAK